MGSILHRTIARVDANDDALFDDIERQYEALFEDLERDRFRSFRKRLSKRHKSRDGRFFALCVRYRHRHSHRAFTCLEMACADGKTKFVEFLLVRGAFAINDVNDLHDKAPIHLAVRNGHADVLRILLRHASTNPNREAPPMDTALHIAVRRGDSICAGLLLEHGASASLPNSKGLTAVHYAAMKGHRDMVKLLLTESWRFPDIDTYRDWNDRTAREVIVHNLPYIKLPQPRAEIRPLTPSLSSRERFLWDLKYHCVNDDEITFRICLAQTKTYVLVQSADDLLTMAVKNGWRELALEMLKDFDGNRLHLKKASTAALWNRDHDVLLALLNADRTAADVNLLLSAIGELTTPSRISDGELKALKCVQIIQTFLPEHLTTLSNWKLKREVCGYMGRTHRRNVVRSGAFHGANPDRECACSFPCF